MDVIRDAWVMGAKKVLLREDETGKCLVLVFCSSHLAFSETRHATLFHWILLSWLQVNEPSI
jgi:hypothetical protein